MPLTLYHRERMPVLIEEEPEWVPDRSARYNLCVAFKSIVITVEFLTSH